MVLFKIICDFAFVLCFLNQLYYIVGAIREVFAYSTKRYISYWLYNCYIYTALVNLFMGNFISTFVWACIAIFEYQCSSEFIYKHKEESNLD